MEKILPISVIINTYNNGKYIVDAINSILGQTFSAFELIVVNDGSTDRTKELLEAIEDDRLVLLHNDKNLGIPVSLNKALKRAKGKYIARMDGDDISASVRLATQYQYMESHVDIDICGSAFKKFGKDFGVASISNDEERIRAQLLFSSPLGHSTWFIRRSFMLENGFLYNPDYSTSQDYELLYRMMKKARVACLEEILVAYRVHEKSITQSINGIDDNTLSVQKRLFKDLGIHISRRELELWNCCIENISFIDECRIQYLIFRLMFGNKIKKIYKQGCLIDAIKGNLNGKYNHLLALSIFEGR